MFAATDTRRSPWYVVHADDKKRARLNCIAHLLSVIPWKKVPDHSVKLPKRQKRGGYKEPKRGYHSVPQKY
jgi:hypothetical protein